MATQSELQDQQQAEVKAQFDAIMIELAVINGKLDIVNGKLDGLGGSEPPADSRKGK
jgi:hypothetical protein